MLTLDFHVCQHVLPVSPPVSLCMHRNGKFGLLTGFVQQILEKMANWYEKNERVRKSPVPTYTTSCPLVFVILFPHFGWNNSHIYSSVTLEWFPLSHTPNCVVFLPLLIHFLESFHARGSPSTSLWLQSRFLWRKLSLKHQAPPAPKQYLSHNQNAGCTISQSGSAQLMHSFQNVLHHVCSGDIQPRGPNSH